SAESVYDLTVPGAHEFFANSSLIHNSLDWFEEAAANPMIEDAFAQAKLGRNYGPRPRWIASTTPRPLKIIKDWIADEKIVTRRATTHDNPHLPESYKTEID